MWQALREELHPKGLEIVTVALDSAGVDAVRPHVDAAKPTHPSLIDAAHTLDRLVGIVNVPQAVWIDEGGTIVRPPEVAQPRDREPRAKAPGEGRQPRPDVPERYREAMEQVSRIGVVRGYANAIRDWVEHGSDSRFALSPSEVVIRSRLRPPEVAEAAACFELGQHLHATDRGDAAVRWFKEAHRLQPENWTYKRQAWSLVDPLQGPNAVYDSDWLSEIKKTGAENYYDPIPELEEPEVEEAGDGA